MTRLLLALALLAAAPGTAGAATVSLDGTNLVVRAAAGESNAVGLAAGEQQRTVVVTDTGTPPVAGAGCTAGAGGAVVCPGVDTATVRLGDGDDRLEVTARLSVVADGGDGDDPLTGGSRGDELDGGRGNDRLSGGDGDDVLVPGTGRDRVGCGDGEDEVQTPQAGELLSGACELVVKADGDEQRYAAATYPSRGLARWAVACPTNVDLEPKACRGSFTVRELGGRERLLARGIVAGTIERPRETTSVALTALGRRLAARPGGVRATARLRGRAVPSLTWSLRLRS